MELFEAIIPEDIDVLDIGCRPEDLICRVLAVPPVAIRPSVEMDGASNEDDITMKLMVRGWGWRRYQGGLREGEGAGGGVGRGSQGVAAAGTNGG